MIHKAFVKDEKVGKQWFASLDGNSWLPVNREPINDDTTALAALFNGTGNTRPITLARRFLGWQNAKFFTAQS